MDTYSINEFLLELMQKTSRELLSIYFDKSSKKTSLKFPQDRIGRVKRVSEQELRFAMISIFGQMHHPNLQFSVETPTLEEYGFAGNGTRSAASDLSFYHNDEKILNIELKAHNAEQSSIDKDIEKLVRENCNGAWVHILKNENSATVNTLFKKFEKAFDKFQTSMKPISFHILILETKTLLSRKGKENETDYSRNIFNIDYEFWKDLKDKPGKYNGDNKTKTGQLKGDWQIEIFEV